MDDMKGYFHIDTPDQILYTSDFLPNECVIVEINGEKLSEESVQKQIDNINKERAFFHEGMAKAYRNKIKKG